MVCSSSYAAGSTWTAMPRISSRSREGVDATRADVAILHDPEAAGDAALALFHPITARWFRAVFDAPTAPQVEGWPAIARGESTLILAPTGTGKTLTAFLWCLDKLMMRTAPEAGRGCRVVYVSPLKALPADGERNLRSPLVGIADMPLREGVEGSRPQISVLTPHTSPTARSPSPT